MGDLSLILQAKNEFFTNQERGLALSTKQRKEARMAKLGKERVAYGTSDDLLNFGEVLMTTWVADELGGQPVFFNYPKGLLWDQWEEGLFEPYEPPPWSSKKALEEMGLPLVEVFPLHQMVEERVGNLSLGEIAGMIRRERKIKAFRVVSFSDRKPIYVSSKDRRWSEWAALSLKKVVNDPQVKLGGAIIYFLYGVFLARNPSYTGILPGKQKDDVLGAFEAGCAFGGGGGQIFCTGEFDFMTARQWLLWASDHKWRKAPARAARRLLESPFAEEVRRRLLAGEYCPLAYDEEADRFYFVEGQK